MTDTDGGLSNNLVTCTGRWMNNVRHLRYFIAAVRRRSFRRAAEELRVHQSSISRAIYQLEDNLGVSLFERRYTGVRLTHAGQCFLRDILPAIEQLDSAQRTAASAGRAEIGIVRIGILTSLAGGFVRKLIRSYSTNHPEISIEILNGSRDEHIAAVRMRKLDIAFLTGTRGIPECESAVLCEERVHVALPKEHALAERRRLDWPDLQDEHFIVSRWAPGPEAHDYIVRRAADYSTFPNISYKGVVQETLLNLVGLGQGITVVSAAWAAVKLPDVVLRPLTDPADMVPFSAVWSPQNDNPALRRFVSVAHTLAGRVRCGTSDWSLKALGLAPIKSGTSVNGQRLDPSP